MLCSGKSNVFIFRSLRANGNIPSRSLDSPLQNGSSMRIICIAGARPNFMKIAPIMEAFHANPVIEPLLVHTGQHYDEKMSDLFFRELGIPRRTSPRDR